ncbi:hypothetical protein H9W95_12740 [Flavobacterium lindanitolerans]|nr:hypothetical protein [Flavobacterium lindanitolerans]
MKNFTLREEIKVPQAFITEKKNGCLKKQVLFNNKIVLSRLFLLGLLILVAIPSFAQQKNFQYPAGLQSLIFPMLLK